jgi:hypothetical protein
MGHWDIPIGSVKGFADNELASRIAEIFDATEEFDDPFVGIGDEGDVVVIIDVEAETYDAAVADAVQRVDAILSEAGIHFPVDYAALPSPD